MENLYFDAFEKYGAALKLLYPSQLREVADALDKYTETGTIERLEDSFSRLAFMMIICDARYKPKRKKKKGTEKMKILDVRASPNS